VDKTEWPHFAVSFKIKDSERGHTRWLLQCWQTDQGLPDRARVWIMEMWRNPDRRRTKEKTTVHCTEQWRRRIAWYLEGL
jgi:hypothetical protein